MLDGEGGIESNSIVSLAAGDHNARAFCRGATRSVGVHGEFAGAGGGDDEDDMMSEDERVRNKYLIA